MLPNLTDLAHLLVYCLGLYKQLCSRASEQDLGDSKDMNVSSAILGDVDAAAPMSRNKMRLFLGDEGCR